MISFCITNFPNSFTDVGFPCWVWRRVWLCALAEMNHLTHPWLHSYVFGLASHWMTEWLMNHSAWGEASPLGSELAVTQHCVHTLSPLMVQWKIPSSSFSTYLKSSRSVRWKRTKQQYERNSMVLPTVIQHTFAHFAHWNLTQVCHDLGCKFHVSVSYIRLIALGQN